MQQGLTTKIGKALQKSSPVILTCFGAIGVVATAVLAVKATPKALERIEKAQEIKMDETGEKLTGLEMVKACWTTYVPAAITGIGSIACIFGINALNKRQQASLISAYAFLERSFQRYKQSVKNVYGEEGHKRVLEDLMVEHPKPPKIYDAVFGWGFDFGETDEEKRLFYDEFSNRYFEATFSQVALAELHINRNFANTGDCPLHCFYDFLGLDTPEELKDLRWYVSDDSDYYFIDLIHEKIMLDDGPNRNPVECWAIVMQCLPTLDPDNM